MDNSSTAGRRTPILLIVVLLLLAGIAAWVLFARPHPADKGGAGGAAGAFVYNASACAQSPDMPASGWDYPQTAATVENWVATRDVGRARVHGWWLWAALNQDASTPGGSAPLWRGWCTSTQAYAATGGEPPAPN
ncbi:MAG: hypothetical protein QOJ27_2240, partial [Sphingomonadales bacterium]|nr:hypothetical protein [Sphingomonadales bacterium]